MILSQIASFRQFNFGKKNYGSAGSGYSCKPAGHTYHPLACLRILKWAGTWVRRTPKRKRSQRHRRLAVRTIRSSLHSTCFASHVRARRISIFDRRPYHTKDTTGTCFSCGVVVVARLVGVGCEVDDDDASRQPIVNRPVSPS
jgi:hypothetical protein